MLKDAKRDLENYEGNLTQTITNTGSQLLADGNINLTATDELTVTGSDLAGTDINLAGNNVTINASQGLLQSSSDSEHLSAGAGINFGSDGIGFTANMAMGESELDSTTLTNQNSQIDASGNLNITSANDTTVAGANLQGGTVNMNVGNNLTVASVQDIGTVEGEQWDVSLSVTIGAGASVGASVGYGETEGSSAWVNEQTSIIGTDAVNINVGGHTQIDGALIANIDEEGVDQGNLLLDTGTLGYSDIEDHDEYESFYLNVGFSTGGTSGANEHTGANQDKGGNSWSVEGNYGSHDYEQTNHATVGNGQIIVRDDPNVDLSGLNRDVSTAQETTREESTEVELYVSSTAISAVRGMFTTDDPNTPEDEGQQNTFNQWASNMESLVDPQTYQNMVEKLQGVTEPLVEAFAAVKHYFGTDNDELAQQAANAFVQNIAITLNVSIGEINLDFDEDTGQLLALVEGKVYELDMAQMGRQEDYLNASMASGEALDNKLDALSPVPTMDEINADAWASTEGNFWAGFDSSAIGGSGLDMPGLQISHAEQTNLQDYSDWMQPQNEAFRAQYGEVGDGFWDGALHIGGATLGAFTHSLYDGATDMAGLGLGGMLGSPELGMSVSNWAQDSMDDWVGSFGPGAFSGGFENEEFKTGVDFASVLVGGAGLLNGPRQMARWGDEVVPNNTPNTLVIGRVDDLQGAGALKPGEFTLLPRMVDDLGTPRANWERNSTLLRQEMRTGNPIRDASAHKPDSFPVPTPLNPDRTVRQTFTGMERNILQNRGWTFDGQFWRPPVTD